MPQTGGIALSFEKTAVLHGGDAGAGAELTLEIFMVEIPAFFGNIRQFELGCRKVVFGLGNTRGDTVLVEADAEAFFEANCFSVS